MKERIAVIDYGSGNLHSAAKALEHVAAGRAQIVVTANPAIVAESDRIVLPGQGAFGDCIGALNAIPGMRAALEDTVIGRRKPFLGICVGMQLLASASQENGQFEGLGWISGEVVKIRPGEGRKIPHMGWNELLPGAVPHPLTTGLQPGDHAYFVHSYRFAVDNPAHELAHAEYGQKIAAIVGRDNIVGMQFHPEKSQAVGLSLVGAFLDWKP